MIARYSTYPLISHFFPIACGVANTKGPPEHKKEKGRIVFGQEAKPEGEKDLETVTIKLINIPG